MSSFRNIVYIFFLSKWKRPYSETQCDRKKSTCVDLYAALSYVRRDKNLTLIDDQLS